MGIFGFGRSESVDVQYEIDCLQDLSWQLAGFKTSSLTKYEIKQEMIKRINKIKKQNLAGWEIFETNEYGSTFRVGTSIRNILSFFETQLSLN